MEHLHHYVFGKKIYGAHRSLHHWLISSRSVLTIHHPDSNASVVKIKPVQNRCTLCYMQKHIPIADCLSRLVVNATAVEDESFNLQISRS